MSNRQERIRRKASKRREKFLAMADTALARPGFRVRMQLFDFGCQLAVAFERECDGLRQAVRWVPDRLFRRVPADLPQRLAVKLDSYFASRPIEAR